MKIPLVPAMSLAILFGGTLSNSDARDITAAELASFLGVSSWETKVTLPVDSYMIDICPIVGGKIGDGLFGGQADWSKDPKGKFTIICGPNGVNYRFTMSSNSAGTYGITPQIPRFEQTYSPNLPEVVSEGVFILFVDMMNRDVNGAQNDPSTYRRGFVLKVTKKR